MIRVTDNENVYNIKNCKMYNMVYVDNVYYKIVWICWCM